MDLALNNLQRWICHKIQQTNKTNKLIEFEEFLDISIWPIDWTLTDTTNPGGSYDNKEVLHTSKISRIGTSPLDIVQCHAENIHFYGDLRYSQRIPSTFNRVERLSLISSFTCIEKRSDLFSKAFEADNPLKMYCISKLASIVRSSDKFAWQA